MFDFHLVEVIKSTKECIICKNNYIDQFNILCVVLLFMQSLFH